MAGAHILAQMPKWGVRGGMVNGNWCLFHETNSARNMFNITRNAASLSHRKIMLEHWCRETTRDQLRTHPWISIETDTVLKMQ
mmetsp:Transcript_64232/g.134037  ORF Transcript_64232/g.134037 Transcript_64232/m.134037 type:complete len:83 (-) Transcript_64232:822-1070(-)